MFHHLARKRQREEVEELSDEDPVRKLPTLGQPWPYPRAYPGLEDIYGENSTNPLLSPENYIWPYPLEPLPDVQVEEAMKDELTQIRFKIQAIHFSLKAIEDRLKDHNLTADEKKALSTQSKTLTAQLDSLYTKLRMLAPSDPEAIPATDEALSTTEDLNPSVMDYPDLKLPEGYKEVIPKVTEHEAVPKEEVSKARWRVPAGLATAVGKSTVNLVKKPLHLLPKRIRAADPYVGEELEEPDMTEKDLNTIEQAWRWGYNTYRPSAQIEGWDYDWMQFMGENAGFIANKRDGTMYDYVIAFRGTQDNAGMTDDLNSTGSITFEHFCGVKLPFPVHIALAPAYRVKAAEPYLAAYYPKWKQNPDEIRSILVTGHSLGGGTAEGCAALMSLTLPASVTSKIVLVTNEGMRGIDASSFSQLMETPRFRKINEQSYRLYHEKDPIPYLPPQLGREGFRHVGKKAFKVTREGNKGLLEGRLGNIPLVATAFDANVGPHSMRPTSAILKRLRPLVTAAARPDATEADRKALRAAVRRYTAYGRIKRRRVRGGQKISSEAMKRKMAWVRSFKKKK